MASERPQTGVLERVLPEIQGTFRAASRLTAQSQRPVPATTVGTPLYLPRYEFNAGAPPVFWLEQHLPLASLFYYSAA